MATNGSEIEKDLECPVCLKVFENAKYLACMHTFCEACIERIANNDPIVICPECRHSTVLDRTARASGLKPNRLANRMIETLRNRPEALSATIAAQEQVFEQQVCRKHPPYPLKYYCKKCDDMVCSECSMEEHHDHAAEVCPVKVILEDRKGAIKDLLEQSEDKVRQHQECFQSLENEWQNGIEIVGTTVSESKGKFDECFEALVAKKRELNKKLSQRKNNQARWLKEAIGVNQTGRILLKRGTDEEILSIQQQLSDAMANLTLREPQQESLDEAEKEELVDLAKLAENCQRHLRKLSMLLKSFQRTDVKYSESDDTPLSPTIPKSSAADEDLDTLYEGFWN